MCFFCSDKMGLNSIKLRKKLCLQVQYCVTVINADLKAPTSSNYAALITI